MSEPVKDEYTEVQEEPRPMSEDDVRGYHGLTLNDKGEEERTGSGGDGDIHLGNIHVHMVNLESLPLWKKVVLGLICVCAIVVFLVFAVAAAWIFVIGGAVVFVAGIILYFLRKYIL